jgi:hypothetical protein
VRLTDAQTERICAIVSAHQAGLSIHKIAGVTELRASRIHQFVNAPEAQGDSNLVEPTATVDRRFRSKDETERPEPETKIQSRLQREVEPLRRYIDRS